MQAPLAEILRPKKLSDVYGQQKLLGNDGLLTKLLSRYEETKFFPSIILWGPPGCGKTTIARLIAQEINRKFFEFSAVNASVKDIEKAVFTAKPIFGKTSKNEAQQSLLNESTLGTTDKSNNLAPVVFIDEIHRFNKAQQDAFLPLVEQGKLLFVGATTENPSFEVISPLLSRTRVLVMEQLSLEDLEKIIEKALEITQTTLQPDLKKYLAEISNGDARTCINIFEIASNLAVDKIITKEDITQALQKNNLNFDLHGEEFYNTISALHKSMRGSDPNGALYWLARMLEAGQDPVYIARRLIRFATEDIGVLDPQALVLAVSAFTACQYLGMPECNLALAETVVYLAKSPKSNKIYIAYGKAADDAKTYGNLPVPMHIRNAPTKLMKELGYGKGYDYTHSDKGEKNKDICYFPDELGDRKYL